MSVNPRPAVPRRPAILIDRVLSHNPMQSQISRSRPSCPSSTFTTRSLQRLLFHPTCSHSGFARTPPCANTPLLSGEGGRGTYVERLWTLGDSRLEGSATD